jgi:hypothetical protein
MLRFSNSSCSLVVRVRLDVAHHADEDLLEAHPRDLQSGGLGLQARIIHDGGQHGVLHEAHVRVEVLGRGQALALAFVDAQAGHVPQLAEGEHQRDVQLMDPVDALDELLAGTGGTGVLALPEGVEGLVDLDPEIAAVEHAGGQKRMPAARMLRMRSSAAWLAAR